MLTRFVGHTIRQPFHDLPVAAQPAVLSAAVGAVVRGIILDDYDICGESGARVGAFDQVVAEQSVPWKTMTQNAVHRIYFVDSFSGERTFAEKILVNIGDGARIGIKPGLAGEDGGEARAGRALHAYINPRLQNAVSGDDDIVDWIDDRLA